MYHEEGVRDGRAWYRKNVMCGTQVMDWENLVYLEKGQRQTPTFTVGMTLAGISFYLMSTFSVRIRHVLYAHAFMNMRWGMGKEIGASRNL